MSGGGSGGGGNFGGGGGSEFDCQKVSIKTSIVSPDPTVLATLRVGDVLDISLRSAAGPLIAVTGTGNTLGSVFTTNPSLLIDCITKGFTYKAVILNITGGDCQILITVR